jgi:hypothetical protein
MWPSLHQSNSNTAADLGRGEGCHGGLWHRLRVCESRDELLGPRDDVLRDQRVIPAVTSRSDHSLSL